MLHVAGTQQAMAFLEIPVHRCQGLLLKSAVALQFVEALQYMHRVRKSGNAKMGTRVVDDSAERSYGRRPKRKRAGEDAATV